MPTTSRVRRHRRYCSITGRLLSKNSSTSSGRPCCLGCTRWGACYRRPDFALRIGLLCVTVASLYWSIVQTIANPSNAYFSPFTRAWELAIGGLIAVFATTIVHIPGWARASATWLGLGSIVLTAFWFSATTQFPGWAALLPVCGTVLVVAGGIGHPRFAAGHLLGVPPIRWLGRISFSLYLWHWPVLMLAAQRSTQPLSGMTRLSCVVVAVVLAQLTFVAVEQPFRSAHWMKEVAARTDWQRARRSLAVGAGAVMVALWASTFTLVRADHAIAAASIQDLPTDPTIPPLSAAVPHASVHNRLGALTSDSSKVALDREQRRIESTVHSAAQLTAMPANLDPPLLQIGTTRSGPYWKCLQGTSTISPTPCYFGDPNAHDLLVVFGDSHAVQWMGPLDPYAKSRELRLALFSKASCPLPNLPGFGIKRSHILNAVNGAIER